MYYISSYKSLHISEQYDSRPMTAFWLWVGYIVLNAHSSYPILVKIVWYSFLECEQLMVSWYKQCLATVCNTNSYGYHPGTYNVNSSTGRQMGISGPTELKIWRVFHCESNKCTIIHAWRIAAWFHYNLKII